ncbi:MAG: hypothetical protein ACLUOF_05285 [Ruminococcus sp.]
MDTLEYARTRKNDTTLLSEILAKARLHKGLSHREAAVLLLNEDSAVTEQLYKLANQIKLAYYGNRIVIFAPSTCRTTASTAAPTVPTTPKQTHLPQGDAGGHCAEKTALQDMGHKRLAIEAGEDRCTTLSPTF